MSSATRITFASPDAFYEARGGRRSGERDFGVWWTEDGRWPYYRISIVHDTGDVYAINLSTRAIELLANVGHDAACSNPFRHTPLCAYESADALLYGWAEQDSMRLSWARVVCRDEKHGAPV